MADKKMLGKTKQILDVFKEFGFKLTQSERVKMAERIDEVLSSRENGRKNFGCPCK